MDCITDPLVDEVTVMKSARSGGTQAAIDNPIGYFIDQDPGPLLIVHPGKTEGRDWSKDHLDTMARDTACLHGKIYSDKIKDRKNEILHKSFPGGILYIIGANSAAGFRQKTIQRVFLDDIDSYDSAATGEGDQVELARNRTLTYLYHSRKIIKVSTSTIRGLSRIEQEFFSSDQRHYRVPCPKCNHYQIPIFSSESQFMHLSHSYLRFDPENCSWVYYECENCHYKIEERYKLRMIQSGKWHPIKPEIINHRGFHISELISPFSSWLLLANDFLLAKRNRERLRVFINQRLAETFIEEKTYEVDEDSLLRRVENYLSDEKQKIPAGILVLTAGVDIQLDRLEIIILGWGASQENWFLDRRIIHGSPERDSTWNELDEYLAKPWRHDSGIVMAPWTTHGLNCVCIDSGYATENVYQYVKRRQSKRFFATKGDEGFKKPFIIDVKYEKRFRARLAIIAVDAIKSRIYDRLNDKPLKPGDIPPGYMHFSQQCNQEFFDQLTSERRMTKLTPAGYPKLVWELKEGFRNEVLDCYVLNFAALTLLNPDFEILQRKLNDQIEQSKLRKIEDEIEMQDATSSVIKKQTKQKQPKRSNFTTDW